MRSSGGTFGAALLAALLAAAPHRAEAGVISPALARDLQARAPGEEVAIIVELADKVDPGAFAVRDRRLRDNRLAVALKERAGRGLPPLRARLDALGAKGVKELWLIGGLAATVPAAAVARLADWPGLRSIRLDAVVEQPVTTQTTSATPEWNVALIRAPALWSLGLTGAGAVVAGLDTGVDPEHPDLRDRWRGGTGGWYDPYGQHASPHDASGHGTQTMGIMVGGAAGGSAIGVAPGALWIAAKIFDDAGQGTLSGIHLALQWLLDPDGDPATVDAPDVVNASWTITGPAGSCDLEFQADVQVLEAAGVGVVFAAGNGGPGGGTSESPANNPGAFSVGAVDSSSTVATFSSRGPSACDGSVFPSLAAPGVDIWTSDLSYGGLPSYAIVSGTSFAAPHLAGGLALLAAAFPSASIAQVRSAVVQGALDLGAAGADEAYGWGLADLAASRDLLAAGAGSPPVITSAPVTTATAGALYFYQVQATDPEGTAVAYALDAAPAGMIVGADTGIVSWTPAGAQVGPNPVAVRAADGSGLSSVQSFSVTVAPENGAPVASDDAWTATAGVALSVGAPGVLANDSDPEGDPLTAVLIAGPAHGTLTLRSDGSFGYTAASSFAGTDGFRYAPTDGQLLGAAATVTLTVAASNDPPVAANDSFSAPYRKSVSYTPKVLAVLTNDRDPDGSLVPGSVRIVTAPNQGGTATVNTNGTVSYTPKQRFRGRESFAYAVKDDDGATSNVATVSVEIK